MTFWVHFPNKGVLRPCVRVACARRGAVATINPLVDPLPEG
jgi:hypothetical protein